MVPIITACDALGEVYENVAEVIPMPIGKHLELFTQKVIQSLVDKDYRESITERARCFAKQHDWSVIAEEYEKVIINHPKYKARHES